MLSLWIGLCPGAFCPQPWPYPLPWTEDMAKVEAEAEAIATKAEAGKLASDLGPENWPQPW